MKATDSWVGRFFQDLLDNEKLRVPTHLCTKYRNKITYSVPIEEFSDFAQDDIQDVCRWINDNNTVGITEVMVKSTRSGDLMVRFTLNYQDGCNDETQTTSNTTTTDQKNEMAIFGDAVRDAFPAIVCLCYNVAPAPGTRPFKTAPLTFLTDQHTIAETTPDGLHTYRLGPDTFSEVNPTVEAQQYAQKQVWLRQRTAAATATNETLLVSGRDISAFALGYGTSFFESVIAIQHCPLVHRDAKMNLSSSERYTVLHCPNKADMGTMLLTHTQKKTKKKKNICGAVLTGGRKGLHPNYLKFLVEHETIAFLIYNSCSTVSLVRDMQGLLRVYRVEDFRSYDFFPGTAYSASLTYLVRRRGPGLFLPVGPAGVGKSSLAERLATECSWLAWWQRDAVFAATRRECSSLSQTKQKVHQELLRFLQSSPNGGISVVDSTNGNAGARALYVVESKAETVVAVNFESTNVDFLLKRTANRLGDNNSDHPSFPTTVEEQRTKHENILRGITYPTVQELSSASATTARYTVVTVNVESFNADDLVYFLLAIAHTSGLVLQTLALPTCLTDVQHSGW